MCRKSKNPKIYFCLDLVKKTYNGLKTVSTALLFLYSLQLQKPLEQVKREKLYLLSFNYLYYTAKLD